MLIDLLRCLDTSVIDTRTANENAQPYTLTGLNRPLLQLC